MVVIVHLFCKQGGSLLALRSAMTSGTGTVVRGANAVTAGRILVAVLNYSPVLANERLW